MNRVPYRIHFYSYYWCIHVLSCLWRTHTQHNTYTSCTEYVNGRWSINMEYTVYESRCFFQSLPLSFWTALNVWMNLLGNVFSYFNAFLTWCSLKWVYGKSRGEGFCSHFFSSVLSQVPSSAFSICKLFQKKVRIPGQQQTVQHFTQPWLYWSEF